MYPDQWRQRAPLPIHITILYLISIIGSAIADVLVYSTLNRSYEDVVFQDAPSRFGGSIPFFDGIEGYVVYANPPNACNAIDMPPNYWDNYTGKWFVLISAEGCSYEEKIRAAQDANFDLAIVHNVYSSKIAPMTVNNSKGIVIPSTFISEEAGLRIRDYYQYMARYTLIVDDGHFPFNINTNLLIPFIIIVAFCFCPILCYVIVNFIKERRRAQRRRLPSSTLNKIPVQKYKKGSPYETCYICISDFVEGEKVRVLLCCHVFHCECIDPWLTRYRRICPTCKRKVFSADEVHGPNPYLSDTDSDTETDDRSPLIRSGTTQTQGGTFVSQQVHPIIRNFFRQHNDNNISPSSSGFSSSTVSEVSSNATPPTDEDPRLAALNPSSIRPPILPELAPMIHSINSVESVGSIPAAIASTPSFSGSGQLTQQRRSRKHIPLRREQKLPTRSLTSIPASDAASNSQTIGEPVHTQDVAVVPEEGSPQSDRSGSGLVI